MLYGPLSYLIYLHDSSLNSPTLVAHMKDKTASLYLLFDSRPRTDVFLGLALAPLTR